MRQLPDESERCEAEVRQKDAHDRGVRIRRSRPCANRAVTVVRDPSAGPTRVCATHLRVFERRGWV